MTKTLNVAMIGGGFMGKAHALAYAAMPMFFWPPPATPHRRVVVDVTPELAETARRRFGFDEAATDWKAVVTRERHRRRRHRDPERQSRPNRDRGG